MGLSNGLKERVVLVLLSAVSDGGSKVGDGPSLNAVAHVISGSFVLRGSRDAPAIAVFSKNGLSPNWKAVVGGVPEIVEIEPRSSLRTENPEDGLTEGVDAANSVGDATLSNLNVGVEAETPSPVKPKVVISLAPKLLLVADERLALVSPGGRVSPNMRVVVNILPKLNGVSALSEESPTNLNCDVVSAKENPIRLVSPKL